MPGFSACRFPRRCECDLWAARMARAQLSDRPWARIHAALSATRGPGRPAQDDRRFIEAVLWWRRTGVPWRDLPEEFSATTQPS
ncbi:MAG: transposase [Pseudomonadota bacterium]